ncbi:ATP-NAD kinase [Haloferacaceae archaeon DSL9]
MRVAVVGDSEEATGVRAALAEESVSLVGREAADVLVTVGDDAFVATATTLPGTPLFPVGSAGRTPAADALEPLTTASESDALAESVHSILAVEHDGQRRAAAIDLTLMTSEPTRISEYAVVHADGRREEFRSDGVVLATPFGSDRYARAAGGPILDAGTGVSVVPISPFATRSDSWVLTPPVRLSVERDDDVTLFADGRAAQTVSPLSPIDVTAAGSVRLLRQRHR